MHQTIAQVGGGRLYQLPIKADPIVVGTPAWYDWLDQNTAFLFTDHVGSFTARKNNSVYNGQVWSATRFWQGRFYHIPLGPSRSLTLSRLQAAAERLMSGYTTTDLIDVSTECFSVSSHPAYGTGFPLDLAEGLVRARLHRPVLSEELLVRERLITRLQSGLRDRLTLLCAPAGFGKSTLLAQWAICCGRPVAWLSLEQGDEELAVFVQLLLAALRTCFPTACAATARLLARRHGLAVEPLAAVLLADLAALPGEALLVLDDYHLIRQDAVQRLLTRLVEHSPSTLHLALACRWDPPLPLMRWRARGWLQDVRGAELCLTEQETEGVLAPLVGAERARASAKVVWQRTEGWVALVRLAALGLRQAADAAAYLQRWASGPDGASGRYLREEVLLQQPERVRQVLLGTAQLKQFNGPLCAQLLQGEETLEGLPALLEWMEQAQLVTLRQEGEPGWYRCHPLLRQVLEQQAREEWSAAEVARWRLRASEWYASRGNIAEAVEHALAAGERERAVRLLEAQVAQLVEQERVEELEGWLDVLEQEQREGSAALLLADAWLKQVHGRLMELPGLLMTAGQRLDSQARDTGDAGNAPYRFLRASLALAWSQYQSFTGQVEASLESARSTLEWTPPGYEYIASHALAMLALARQASGQEDVALFELNNALTEQAARHSVTARLLFTQAMMYFHAGKLRQVEQAARHLLYVAGQANLVVSQCWAHLLLGMVHYEWNELAMAANHFNTVIAQRRHAHFFAVRDALCGLALTYQAQGLSGQAKEVAGALLEWVVEQQNMRELGTVYAFQAQLALLQDDVELAETWSAMAGDQAARGSTLCFDCAEAHLFLARGDEASAAQAQALLHKRLQEAESSSNRRKAIKVLAMQAWAYRVQGDEGEALQSLRRALALGRCGGFVRSFADLPALARVLPGPGKAGNAQGEVDAPLAAYLQRVRKACRCESTRPVAEGARQEQGGAERLTNRERQILGLLDRDLTNKEIARELVVTPGTVKVHTNSIYRKLSVNNRRSAIMLAKSLGILITQ